MFDVQTLRKEFPTLARELEGHRLVYLDSAASSQTPVSVLDAMDHYFEKYEVAPLTDEARARVDAELSGTASHSLKRKRRRASS